MPGLQQTYVQAPVVQPLPPNGHEPGRLIPTIADEHRGHQTLASVEYRPQGFLGTQDFQRSRGSKCVVGISAAQPTELYQQITDAERYVASTQLVVRTSQDPLLAVEDFSIERLIEFWDATVLSALQDGYPFVRLGAEAAWWMPQVPGMPEFIRYETELNRYAAQHAQSILCLYDLTRYGAGVIVDLLRVHPIILLSGLVLENPYYLPPDELLAVQG
jgi:hypothetical protein